MRPRGSITGPLVIILLGVIFLIHAVSPDFPLADWIGRYWPYLLILWGGVALIEVAIRFLAGGVIPTNGVSGGAWFFVVVICLVGTAFFQFRSPDTWWRHTDWGRGFDNAFGDEHEFTVNGIQKSVGPAPHIVLGNYRGDVKITGADGSMFSLTGHKTIRAMRDDAAESSNEATPVEVSVEGKNVVIHCNQDRAGHRTLVTTNLDLTVPKGASLEVDSTSGDLEVTSLTGDLSLRSGDAGMRLQDIGGNIMVETRRSDLIRCTNVKGAVELKGRGSDVELNHVNGPVNISGDYSGTVSLRAVDRPVRMQNTRTELRVESLPGEARADRGSITVQDAVGPLVVNAHSSDISLENISNAEEVSVDRGDVDLKPGRLPLSKMSVRCGSGNIELALPEAAAFALTANTDSGEIQNDFGDGLKEQANGRGAHLEGAVGTGPTLDLITGRGTITVRKAKVNPQSTVAKATNLPRFVLANIVP